MKWSVVRKVFWCFIAINFGWTVLEYPIVAQIFLLAVGFLTLADHALDLGRKIIQKIRGQRGFREKTDTNQV